MRVETSNNLANPYKLVFVGQPEIEVVRNAFSEHVQNAELRGTKVPEGAFDRRISNWWPKDNKNRLLKERSILLVDPRIVTDKLYELHQNTDMVIAEMREGLVGIDDIDHFESRLSGVEWRARLGSRALELAELVELRVSDFMVEDPATAEVDAAIDRILAPKQLGPG